jgi:hypothetical protein
MKTYSNSHQFKSLSFLWAVPRSSSTAFLRGMQNNDQLTTFHEPYTDTYHFSLERKTNRLIEDAVLTETDAPTGDAVNQQLLDNAKQSRVFVKELAFQGEPYVDDELLQASDHVLLVRHPWSVYSSIMKLKPDFNEDEFGFTPIERVFERLLALKLPIKVIDSDRFREFPKLVYQQTCEHLGINFSDKMLSWDSGKVRLWQEYERKSQAKWHVDLENSKGVISPTPLQKLKGIDDSHDLIIKKAEKIYYRLLRYCAVNKLYAT